MLSMVELQRRTTKPFGTSPAGRRLLASRSISDSSNCLKNKVVAKCMSVFVCVISMPDERRGWGGGVGGGEIIHDPRDKGLGFFPPFILFLE